MTPDRIHEYELRNAVERLNNDPRMMAQDRKPILSFLVYIKAARVSTGRQAKYVNMLRTASLMLRVPRRPAAGISGLRASRKFPVFQLSESGPFRSKAERFSNKSPCVLSFRLC
jgi:hypothetical protein